MVDITHNWDESDTKAELRKAFEDYKNACYGRSTLNEVQHREVEQAFFSGVHYLNCRDDYSPGDIQRAISEILKDEEILG